MEKKSVLIASPINKPSNILELFLESLNMLKVDNINVEYFFIDDNDEKKSSEILNDFILKNKGNLVNTSENDKNIGWEIGEHVWTGRKIQKIAYYKNKIIDHFLNGEWDYIFFVDSDLILNPNTINQLIEDDKEIVSNIFWTKWDEGGQELPQVWQKDFYTLYDNHMLRNITPQEIRMEEFLFLGKLRVPGVYRVGGLGACTLIKRNVLEKGVHFGEIYNLSFWGEDRSFCVRAVAYGFELFVDTYNPAFHIFRESEVEKAKKILQTYKK